MRSTVSGVAVGLLVAAILVVVALMVLPDLVPGAGPTPVPTPRDISGGSPGPGESPAPPSPGSTTAPSASLDPGGSASPSPSGAPDIGLAVGQRAPALIVDRLGGGTIDLSTFRGSPVWVNFMATWCPSCRDEIPQMVKYQALLGDRGLAVVLVDVREDADTVAAFVKSLEYEAPVGLDPAGRAQRAWGAFALPIHYFIDADGIVRSVMYGELSPPQFEEALTRIIPGLTFEPSPPPSQPAGSGAPAAPEEPAASAPAAP